MDPEDGFNPRPREGSDQYRACTTRLRDSFNPRPREGSDLTPIVSVELDTCVSIHAPVKGATVFLA